MSVATMFSAGVLGQSPAQNSINPNDAQSKQIAESIVKTNYSWGEKLNSSGAALKLIETGRTDGRISYQLRAEGLPADHTYSLIQWPVTKLQPFVALQGITIDKSGIAVCAGRPGTCGDAAKPDDPINLQSAPVQGEPLRVALVAQNDSKLRAAVKLIPIPNSGVNQGCRVDAVLLTPHAELISVEGSGFLPKTEVTLVPDSEGEIHETRQRIDETGRFVSALMPAKAGLKTGTVTIQVKAPACNPKVSVIWGLP